MKDTVRRQSQRTVVQVAMASFTFAHTKTQTRALRLGSLLIVVYTKETEDQAYCLSKAWGIV